MASGRADHEKSTYWLLVIVLSAGRNEVNADRGARVDESHSVVMVSCGEWMLYSLPQLARTKQV